MIVFSNNNQYDNYNGANAIIIKRNARKTVSIAIKVRLYVTMGACSGIVVKALRY